MALNKLMNRIDFFGVERAEVKDAEAQSMELSVVVSKEDKKARELYLSQESIGKLTAQSSWGRGASRRSSGASGSP